MPTGSIPATTATLPISVRSGKANTGPSTCGEAVAHARAITGSRVVWSTEAELAADTSGVSSSARGT